MKYSFIIIFIIIFFSEVLGQKLLKTADREFDREQYHKAIELYQQIINKFPKRKHIVAEAYFKIGMSYKKLSLPEYAVTYLVKAIEYKFPDPIVYHYLGQSYQMIMQYDSASVYYHKFDRAVDEKNKYFGKGRASLDFTFNSLKNPTGHEIRIIGRLNSPEHDYCPFLEPRNNKRIYFTSTRFASTHVTVSPESGDFCSNIFYTEKDKEGRWTDPQILIGPVNSNDEEGAACLNRKSSNLYFTRCNYDKNKDRGCRIYFSRKMGSYWGNVQEVEIPGIPDSISIGHPAISDDELTLFFVADSMLGGFGGKDIYKVVREKRNSPFGFPQNLGPQINTEHDEVHPYIRSNGDLYFSSDGHNGMGGLDIFVAKNLGNGQYKLENLGYPINSSHDDFGIVFIGMKEEGYFSTRRIGGMGKTDIFYFIKPEVNIIFSGTVFDNLNGEKIENVDVQIMDENYVLLDYQSTDKDGSFEIILSPGKSYIIFFKAENYSVETFNLSTQGIIESTQIEKDIFMKK
jgi:peptidoglycan-associated lipoprotein